MARQGEFGIREGGLPGPEEEFEEEERLKGGPYRKKLKEAASKEPTPEEVFFQNDGEALPTEKDEEIIEEAEEPIATLRSGKTERSILQGEKTFDDTEHVFHEIKANKLAPLSRGSRNPDLEILPKRESVSAEPFGWDARKFRKSSQKRGKEKRK